MDAPSLARSRRSAARRLERLALDATLKQWNFERGQICIVQTGQRSARSASRHFIDNGLLQELGKSGWFKAVGK